MLIVSAIGKPRNLTALIGPQSITFNWKPPRITQGLVHTYHLRLIGDSGNSSEFTISAQTRCSFYACNIPNISFTSPSLIPFTNYTLEVVAENDQFGRGEIARISARTSEDGKTVHGLT